MLKLKRQYFGHLMWRTDSLEKTLMLGKTEGRKEEKGMTEDEMVGYHHQLSGHEFELAPGVGDGQGSRVHCSPWCCKESDRTEWLNWAELKQHSKMQRQHFAEKCLYSQSYMAFTVVMYGCESWTIKKVHRWRIDAFELWGWRRLLRVPWTARKTSQSMLNEISPEY